MPKFSEFIDLLENQEKLSLKETLMLRHIWTIAFRSVYSVYRGSSDLSSSLNLGNNRDVARILKDNPKDTLRTAIEDISKEMIESFNSLGLCKEHVALGTECLEAEFKIYTEDDYKCVQGMVPLTVTADM